jgi:protein SCO1/2
MRKRGLDQRLILALLALVLLSGAAAALAIGTSAGTRAPRPSSTYAASGLLTPVRQAPPLQLRNYLGRRVNIASYRGKAVLVTFLYTNCPDICPLITSQLRATQNLMGPRESAKVQIIAVSVDPRGDTPSAVAAFLARHGMTGRMQYLIGSARELAPVWRAWGVGSARYTQQPQFVNHTGLIYGITASGKRVTVYAPSFEPAEIAHDVPILAAS